METKIRNFLRRIGSLSLNTERKVFVLGMILLEYLFLFSFLFSDFKLLSFGILSFCAVNGLLVNNKINWTREVLK